MVYVTVNRPAGKTVQDAVKVEGTSENALCLAFDQAKVQVPDWTSMVLVVTNPNQEA